ATAGFYRAKLFKGKSPDEYTFLDWDKPVDEKLVGKIKSQLEKEKLIDPDPKIINVTTENVKPQDWYSKIYTFDDGTRIGASSKEEALNEFFVHSLGERPKKTYFRDIISGSGQSGEILYKHLSNSLADLLNKKAGGDVFRASYKEVSQFLDRAGISGVRYPVGSLSGTTPGPRVPKKFEAEFDRLQKRDIELSLETTSDSDRLLSIAAEREKIQARMNEIWVEPKNYVIFNPKNIQIEEGPGFRRVRQDGKRVKARNPYERQLNGE
ncbi:MAG: hypothetical protein ACYSU8_06390, partial [Planctomycetota bacterium]